MNLDLTVGRVAVIMSVYRNDTKSNLKLAIDSIINQTYSNFIFYIKVDGLVDIEIDDYLNNLVDKRISLSYRSENKGLAISLNELLTDIQKNDFEYIARMDSDDIALPNRIEKQLYFLEDHTEVDMVGGAINEIDEYGNNRGKITKYPCSPEDCKSFFVKRNPVAHPTVMFRRSFFEKAGWEYPTDFIRNEDTRLWHEGYKHGCVIANIPDVILNFRMTDSMFKNRRNGREFASSQLKLRKLIKKDLGYGFMADVYAYATYLLMISPNWLLKFAYKILR